MNETLEMKKLKRPEKTRTYVFPDGDTVTIHNVVAVGIRPSGSHRLETAEGMKWIIPVGWLAIELDVDEWTF